jgi:hypothetical protein
MGDRANVKIVDRESTVFLYTHNRGTDLPVILKTALIRGQQRWDDGQYLARIIFCEMIDGNLDGLTGFGISSVIGDGDDRVLTINIQDQTAQVNSDRPFPLKGYINWKNPRWTEPKRCRHCNHVIGKEAE